VRYVALNPPPGFETAGVWGPPDLEAYFAGVPFHAARRPALSSPPSADVAHVHGLSSVAMALRPGRGPVVLTVHTDIETQGRTAGSRVLRTLARILASRADAVIAVSDRVGRSFPRAHVIAPVSERLPPPTMGRDEMRASLGTDPGRVVVVTVARLHPDKAPDTFVRAVATSGAEGWICGDGPLRSSLEAMVAGTSVRLLGYRDDVSNVLGAADVFALPSAGEAYGIAVQEALGAGLPVVATDAGAMREIVGDAGIVVTAGAQAAFSDAVVRLVSDTSLRRELVVRARDRVLPSPDELVAALGKVYEKVCR
jgi:glycosyltransferase involved in cell wall biosynthesis